VCAVITAALSMMALVGWVLHVGILKRLLPGLPPMKANAALCYLLAIVSLVVFARSAPGSRRRGVAAGCAAVVLLVGAATLAEYVFGLRLGIDQLLFSDRVVLHAPYPGRPAANTAVEFVLLGAALLAWDVRLGRWWATSVLAWLAATVGLLAVTGYATGAESLISLTARQHFALNSAIALVLMPFAILLARPEQGEIAMLASEGQGGVVLRRLLPVAIALPSVLAALTLAGQRLGLFSAAVGVWLFTSIVTFTLVAVAWLLATTSERAGQQRSQLEGMVLAVAETASDAIVTVDGTGRITYANAALASMFGQRLGGIVGRPSAILFPARHRDAQRQRLAQLRVSGDPDSIGRVGEATGLRSDGREFPIEISRSIWTADGQPVMAGIIRDVSARHRVEQKLRGLLESAPDAIVIVDAAGEIVLVNTRTEAVFGYTREELIGRPVELLMPEQKRRAHAALRDGYARDPQPRHSNRPGDFKALRKDGSVFPAEITLNPIQTDDGLLISSAIRDVTDRRRAEQATARLAAIVESSPDGIIGLTPDGMIESWNAGAQRLYGHSAEEAIGQSITIVNPPEHTGNLGHLNAALCGTAVKFESEDARRDGSRVEVGVTLSPIRDGSDAIIGVSCLAQDMSVRKRAERELQRLAQAAEHATDAVISIDLDARVRHWNAGAERLYGWSAREATGRTLHELIAFTDEPRDEIARMLAGESAYQVETRRWRKDGTIIDVLLTISPWIVDGRVVGVTGIAIDLSERKQVERAREQLLSDLEEAQRVARVGSWSWDQSVDETTWSAQMYEIFGRDPADGPATREEFFASVHPDDRERLAAGYAHTFDGPSFELDHRIIAGDGVQRTVHVCGHEDPTRPGYYVGTFQDVTEQRRAEAELRRSEEQLRTVFEGAPIGVALADAHVPFTLLQANSALGEMLGVEPALLIGRGALTVIDEPQRAAAQSQLQRLLEGEEQSVSAELQIRRACVEQLWVDVNAAVISDADGRPEHLVFQLQDITSRKQYEQELRIYAERDPLTGLLNRRRLEEELARAVAEKNRYGTPATLLVGDLDNLKLINDTIGHKAGDELIKGVARALSSQVRETDALARIGGDEFAILLHRTGLEQAQVLAERLRVSVLDLDLVASQQRLRTSLSIGIAPLGEDLSAEESQVAADLAMYEAKRHGRNRVATSRRAFSEHAMAEHLDWMGRLRSALADDRFELHAQPITELRSGEVHYRELLLRMREPDGELLLPGAFIPTAERFGLITELDRWVVHEAIRILADDRHSNTTYTINLSGVSVGDPELLAMIEREITDAQVDPRRLVFEFTETAAINDLSASREFTHGLSRIGCASALDDFGSGFGSFSYLKHLPVQYVKIDGQFVRDLPSSEDDRVLVKAIVDVARALRKQTIAEFVGSDKAVSLLRDYGVDYAQGFHLGMPEPIA
jgi:diguanylate cyclase (GGDEF)-like protein/PAS domain S-box-containing protein